MQIVETLSLEEWLEISETLPYKSEFINGYIVRLEEETTSAHSDIVNNLVGLLRPHLKAKGCRVYSNTVGIQAGSSCLMPDVFVTCEKSPRIFTDAPLIIEVLSKSTETYDRSGKFEIYRQNPTFIEYALIEQHKRRIWMWRKQENETWKGTIYIFKKPVEFQSIGLTLTLDQIYADVEF